MRLHGGDPTPAAPVLVPVDDVDPAAGFGLERVGGVDAAVVRITRRPGTELHCLRRGDRRQQGQQSQQRRDRNGC